MKFQKILIPYLKGSEVLILSSLFEGFARNVLLEGLLSEKICDFK